MSALPLTVLVAVLGSDEARVVRGLAEHRARVEVTARCADLADVLAAAASGRGRAAVLSASLHQLDGVALDRLRHDGCAVVVLVPRGNDHAERRMRQLGVRHVLPVDAEPEAVVDALLDAATAPAGGAGGGPSEAEGVIGHRASLRPGLSVDPEAADPSTPQGLSGHLGGTRGRLVAVWGPAGAPGRTTTAVNLAAELAIRPGGALVVDADTYAASVGQLLGLLDEAPGLAAAARSADHGTLDLPGLSRLAPEVMPGLRVLTGLASAHRWPDLRASSLGAVLGLCRLLAGWTVVDTTFCLEQDEELVYDTAAPRRNAATLAALEAADVVVAVGSADPVGLARLVRGLRSLSEAGVTSPSVVVTRVRGSSVGVRGGADGAGARVSEALARYAGVVDPVLIPDDLAAMDAALLAGRTLREVAPASPARQAYQRLAGMVAGPGPTEARATGGRSRRRGRHPRRIMAEGRGFRRHEGVRA
jgi:MinD-like ATPase involved in chromosome partitioning or flagellar assembly